MPQQRSARAVVFQRGQTKAASLADPANADKGNRELARELGVAEGTVRNARKAVAQNYATEKRKGKDGKQYKATKPRSRPVVCSECGAPGEGSCRCGASYFSPMENKSQRKSFAKKLYKEGLTTTQIAEKLGVSQATISGDLTGLSTVDKPARPKGGRPKGSTKPRSRPVEDKARDAVREKVTAGQPVNARRELARELGVSHETVARARRSVDTNVSTEKRKGKDGKTRKSTGAVAPVDPRHGRWKPVSF